MKKAKTFFTISLLGDKHKFTDRNENKEYVYEPIIKDRSGIFYKLPKLINNCENKAKYVSNLK